MDDFWQKLKKQSPITKKAIIFLILAILAVPLLFLVVYNAKTRMAKQNNKISPFKGLNLDGLSSGFEGLQELGNLLNESTTTSASTTNNK